MDEYKVVITQRAFSAINECVLFVIIFSKEASKELYSEIISSIGSLKTFPSAYPNIEGLTVGGISITRMPIPEVEINVHPGLVTIFNPGSFPDDLTPEDYINKNISSIKRNPLILDVLYRCKDVEKSGTGFKRMNEQCKKKELSGYMKKPSMVFTSLFIEGQMSL